MNGNAREAKALKEVMEREKLNWRTFADQGAIAGKWGNPGTPMYYAIDPRGMIRYKWWGHPGERAIDTALERLIKEAEESGKGQAK